MVGQVSCFKREEPLLQAKKLNMYCNFGENQELTHTDYVFGNKGLSGVKAHRRSRPIISTKVRQYYCNIEINYLKESIFSSRFVPIIGMDSQII